MKYAAAAAIVLALLIAPASAARVAQVQDQTPVTRVIGLVQSLEARIESDGVAEQRSYDKYACWCEDALGRKANDISTGKETIDTAQLKMRERKAQISSHAAEIIHLDDDIKANAEAQREATEIRDKDRMDYTDKKTESEQCTGALEAAIKVLTGAGGKKGFLETLQEAKLLSVAAGIRSVLARPQVSNLASNQDIKLVRQFAEKPEDFVAGRAGVLSAAQVAQNPFGDYAPQSTQIQGILKSMYDTFVMDMEKDNAEEAEAQKAFQELMGTKRAEMQTLQLTLDKQNLEKADKTQDLADTTQLRDDTQQQLAADEAFFAETKEQCKVKALEWSERSRLRTEELSGIRKAVEILSSPEAKTIFSNATTTFVQVSAGRRGRAGTASRLLSLAREHGSRGLAELAAQVRAGGHFDEVIMSIDSMMEVLRKEEQADIEHRDRCQNSNNKNKNDIEDLSSTIDKSGKAIDRMDSEKKQLINQINTLEGSINDTQTEMANQLQLRNAEQAAFAQALKDDTDAVELLSQAMVSLSRFYKRNKIPLSLVAKPPTYSEDKDKAPETIWEGDDYGGRKSESQGILAILGMIKEDLEKEILTGRQEDADAQAAYAKSRAGAQKVLDSQIATKMATEKQLAELEAKMFDTSEFKDQKLGDLGAERELEKSLYSDCSWVSSHFDTRRTKRKTEMDGLVEAKSYLAGVEAGSELAP